LATSTTTSRPKDALVAAVIETYGKAYDLMSAKLDQQPTPQARLKGRIQAWVGNRELLAAHGCPVGSLTSELDKRTDDLHTQAAAVLEQLVGFAQRQFEAMGRPDARELAVALVAAYEGIALLANTRQLGLAALRAGSVLATRQTSKAIPSSTARAMSAAVCSSRNPRNAPVPPPLRPGSREPISSGTKRTPRAPGGLSPALVTTSPTRPRAAILLHQSSAPVPECTEVR
jgi:hypothetical protein